MQMLMFLTRMGERSKMVVSGDSSQLDLPRGVTSGLHDALRRLAGVELPHPISMHVNGCPNSCARIQTADIGLKGQIVTDADGNQVEGFQVHLGGGIGLTAELGRKLRAHKVTSAGLDDYVTNVVNAYLGLREDGESFAAWVARADEEALRGEKVLETV